MAETLVTSAFVFLLGLVVGSFLNVCIRRIPARESIVLPASHCPACGTAIKPYDNIPVVSYLLLHGKCRACAAPISVVYPIVELLTGLLFVGCVLRFGLALETVKWIVFCCLIVVLIFTDILERILPDAVNFTGLALGLLFSVLAPMQDGTVLLAINPWMDSPPPAAVLSLVDALGASILFSGALWVFGEVFSRIYGRDALGFGDVKMMAMIGAFMGPKRAFLTLLAGSLLGTVLGIAVVAGLFLSRWKIKVAERAQRMGRGGLGKIRWALARRYALPLGTFLGAGAIFVVFCGLWPLEWYAALFR